MGNISKIKVGNTWHQVKDAAARADNAAHHTYVVKGTHTAAGAAWTGNLPEVDALYDGLTIDFWNPFAGAANVTLNLTLGDGTETGAIPVYLNATTRMGNNQPANSFWRYIYHTVTISNVEYSGWWAVRAYDANTTYGIFNNLGHGNGSYIADSAIYRYQFLFHVDRDTLTPLNNNNNATGTAKTMLTDVEFDPFDEILYYYSTTNYAVNAVVPPTYLAYSYATVDLRYTFNCGTASFTAHKDIYLKVLMQSNGMCKIADTMPLTQTLPTTNDGIHYIFLGRTYSAYQISLYPKHPIYYHDGSELRELEKNAYELPIASANTLGGVKVGQNLSIDANGVLSASAQSGGSWGSITGTISNQTDLQSALNAKVNTADCGGIQVRPDYIISTTDLIDGVSELASGTIYLVYEA